MYKFSDLNGFQMQQHRSLFPAQTLVARVRAIMAPRPPGVGSEAQKRTFYISICILFSRLYIGP